MCAMFFQVIGIASASQRPTTSNYPRQATTHDKQRPTTSNDPRQLTIDILQHDLSYLLCSHVENTIGEVRQFNQRDVFDELSVGARVRF